MLGRRPAFDRQGVGAERRGADGRDAFRDDRIEIAGVPMRSLPLGVFSDREPVRAGLEALAGPEPPDAAKRGVRRGELAQRRERAERVLVE